jgi:YHS domain-containing protein
MSTQRSNPVLSLGVAGMVWVFCGPGRVGADEKATCPVSGKEVAVGEKTPRVLVNGKPLYFCCENCPRTFAKSPERFVKDAGSCPVLGNPAVVSSMLRLVVNNQLFYFC